MRLAKSPGSGGKVKSSAEDFVVEEITLGGMVLERDRVYSGSEPGLSDAKAEGGKFSIFVLQKRDWNTSSALKEISRKVARGIRSAGFAGSKDRTAISTQLCSMYGVEPAQLLGVRLKDITINGAWKGSHGVRLGDLLGNRFTITLKGVADPRAVEEVHSELSGIFPNYYGTQRFGTRGNNIQVGLDIIKGDFESAAMRILSDSSSETNQDAVAARERLASERDFKGALQYFPRYLKNERLVLNHLSVFPNDYANAIRKIPRSVTLMYVHSVESHIFNRSLEERIKSGAGPQEGDLVCAADRYGFPDMATVRAFNGGEREEGLFPVGNIVGYGTANLTAAEKGLMDGMGITPESFKIDGMPELNCKGAFRALFSPYLDFSHSSEGADMKLSFSLPSGSYATVLLDEFTGI